ncbi:MAG: helix-turn-helix domain-containing protein, partial [Pseudomonas sp.]|nr:helix-turn-helix domain-containing protein [Pseudomonas sp.]
AQYLLQHTAQPLAEVALTCGFASASHFNNRFRQAFSATPGQYRAALQQH